MIDQQAKQLRDTLARNAQFVQAQMERQRRAGASVVQGRRPGPGPVGAAREAPFIGWRLLVRDLPASPDRAPKTLEISGELSIALANLRQRTLNSGTGPVRQSEYGQVLAIDETGELVLVGDAIPGPKGEDGSVRIKREILKPTDVTSIHLNDDRYQVVGVAHSHRKPDATTFSGGDLANFCNENDKVGMVVVPSGISYVLVRTQQTSAMSHNQDTWQNKQAARTDELVTKTGIERDRATLIATKELADELGLALYVKDNQVLRKVSFGHRPR